MIACKQCSAQNRDTARFCVRCGTPLDALICSGCGQVNRSAAQFCCRCGRPLTLVCRGCSHPNRAQARFCQHCGLPLTQPRLSVPNAAAAPVQGPGPAGGLGGRQVGWQAGGLVGGRYRIVRPIGRGGMGAVHLVTDVLQPQDALALKELSMEKVQPDEMAELVENFRREAQLLRRLGHPNLVKVYDNFTEAGKEYLVMEFVDGKALDSVVGGRRLDETEVLGYAFQLCDVLDYLHRQEPPIIYRDLKPGNIMVENGSGILKLIDFGIVRFYKPGKRKDTKLLGTPGFAPPEQYGKGQTDARSDIFALGVTLHVLLTNLDVASNPWNYPPVRTMNPAVSPRLEQAIRRATEMEIEKRYQSVAEMRAALLRCRNGQRVAANLPTTGLLAG